MSGQRIERNVDAAFFEVARHVLPEIRHLQSSARIIGKLLPVGIAIATGIENQSSHWICRIHSIIEHAVPRRVALHTLILPERAQQIAERFLWNIFRANRLAQGSQHRMRRAALGRIAQSEFVLSRIEQLECGLAVGDSSPRSSDQRQ